MKKLSGLHYKKKSYWSDFQRLCLYNDFLCRIWCNEQKPRRWRIIVEGKFNDCFDSAARGHFG